MFSQFLGASKLQKSRKHKENHHLCKIDCERIYGAQCACMGRSSAAAHMRTARRGAAHCPADKMGAADGTCCARCVLSALCCTRCAPCALRSISALLYTLCAALHVCDTAQCGMPLQVRSAALRRIYMQRTKIRYPSILSKKI